MPTIQKINYEKLSTREDVIAQMHNIPIVACHFLKPTGLGTLNCGRDGDVKHAVIGGYDRNYLSSASELYAVRRLHDPERLNTRNVGDLIASQMVKRHPECNNAQVYTAIKNTMNAIIKKSSSTDEKKTAKDVMAQIDIKEDADIIADLFYQFVAPINSNGQNEFVAKNFKSQCFIEENQLGDYGDIVYHILSSENAGRLNDKKLSGYNNILKSLGLDELETMHKKYCGQFRPCSIETAVLGRMTTSDILQSYSSAMRISDLIATSARDSTYNDFTAVDEFMTVSLGKKNIGAGHLDSKNLASNTFYVYTDIFFTTAMTNLLTNRTINLNQPSAEATIKSYLKDMIDETLQRLTDIYKTLPIAGQTRHATNPLPTAIYVTVSYDAPHTLENIYDSPVYPDYINRHGTARGSVEKMVKYLDDEMPKMDPNDYIAQYWLSDQECAPKANSTIVKVNSYKELITNLRSMYYSVAGIDENS